MRSHRWSIARLLLVILVGGVSIPAGLTSPVGAQAPEGGWVDASGHSPFVKVVAQVKDAVVNISAVKNSDGGSYHSFDPFFEDWFGPRSRGRQRSLGSGFIFNKDGYILTNYHVINGADEITVRLSDKMELPAEVVGSDQATDLAVIKIEPEHELQHIELGDSDSILVGDWVVAIGNPFPNQGLDRTVTVGVVSAVGRRDLSFGAETPTYQNYIQTDASINPGNSGGPLMNLRGEVIGINSAIASPTGSNVGIGFAIPVNFAKIVIKDLMTEGRVSRGWLGIQPRDLSWDDVEAEGLASANGVMVNSVIKQTPAEMAGLRVGDVITHLDGQVVEDAQHFMQLVWQARAGATIKLDIVRRGQPMQISVRLGDRTQYLASSETGIPSEPERPVRGASDWLQMEVVTATPDRAEEFGTTFNRGVLVTSIDSSSPAYEKGIRVGMIIAEIDHTEIEDRDDFMRVVERLESRDKPVSMLVYDRRGNTGYFAVRPSSSE